MNRKSHLGRYVAIGFLVLILVVATTFGTGLMGFIDPASMLIIAVMSISMIVFSNHWSDYVRAMRIAIGNFECTTKELKASKNAMDLSIKAVFLSGIIGTVVGIISYLMILEDPTSFLGAAAAVALLTLLYACVINIVQYAIKAMIEKEIIYRDYE